MGAGLVREGLVQTVLGKLPAADLGVTHGHEHLFAQATPELAAKDFDLVLNDPGRILPDLEAFRGAGGGAIAEMTTVDYGRDVTVLAQLSRRSGIHVIAVTGFNKAIYCRSFVAERSVAEIARWMAAEVQEGVEGTGIKAGLIKFATSLNAVEPAEEKVLRAAARAHLLTGAPLISHTEAGTMAPEQLAMLAEEGVSPERVVICHLDRNPDVALHLDLARRGAFLSYDQIPKAKYNTEADAIGLVVALAKAGLHRQVLLGGDFARRQYFAGWGGAPGLVYLTTGFRAKLRAALIQEGLPADAVIADLLVHNPARALAFRPV